MKTPHFYKGICPTLAAGTVFALGLLLGAVPTALGTPKSPQSPLDISLTPIGTYAGGPPYDEVAAQIVKHDPGTQRLYVANARDIRLDVLDIREPTVPTLVAAVDLAAYGTFVTSVAVHDGLIAVALVAPVKTDPGQVVLLNRGLRVLNAIEVGAFPDFVTFSPDGRWLLAANEGEPNSYNDAEPEENGLSVDPEGSITIIDLSRGPRQPDVRTATFTAFNGMELNPDIRIYGPNATVAQDLEPEAIAISPDSRTAYVTLQENNALAIVDIGSATVTQLAGLGFKDHRQPGFGLDASDKDNANHIANWPVWGVYMPDEVATYRYHGQQFLVMANEGDTRDYPGYSEESRVAGLTLDPTAFPDAEQLQLPANLGRLTVSTVNADLDGDGDTDLLFAPGGRSFTIRTVTGEVVFDSGDQFEQITAALFPDNFNASNTNNKRDDRSDNKGPEPEGIAIGKVAGSTLAFIGLERIGGVMVYDVSNPFAPAFVDYVNTRTFAEPFDFATAGDLSTEGLVFISAEDSPNGKPLLAVANEVSGTVTLFQIQ